MKESVIITHKIHAKFFDLFLLKMKNYLIILLFIVSLPLHMYAQSAIRVNNPSYFEYTPNTETGLKKVYVINGVKGAGLTYVTDLSITIERSEFSSQGGDDVLIQTDYEVKKTILNNPEDGYGYLVKCNVHCCRNKF